MGTHARLGEASLILSLLPDIAAFEASLILSLSPDIAKQIALDATSDIWLVQTWKTRSDMYVYMHICMYTCMYVCIVLDLSVVRT